MKRGYHKLAEQRGNSGHFAAVTVSVQQSTLNRGVEVKLSLPCDVPDEWSIAAQFGVLYACQSLPQGLKDGKPYQIEVHLIEGHPVDTTMTTVAFASAMALWSALNVPPRDGFSYEVETRQLTVPK